MYRRLAVFYRKCRSQEVSTFSSFYRSTFVARGMLFCGVDQWWIGRWLADEESECNVQTAPTQGKG